jgi:hypothetical protein
LAGKASLNSPVFTGTPTASTPAALDNSTKLGTTAYADAAVGVEKGRAETVEALKAPLASPALTGVPTAPTAAPLAKSTQLATAAYADATQVAGEAATATERSRAEAAEALKLAKASNLSDVASPETSRANLGLGTAAVQPATAFDVKGEAATEKTRAETAESTEKTRALAAEAEAVKLTGNQTVAGVKTFSGEVIVPTPTNATDAARKDYVDAAINGLNAHPNVQYATTGPLPANTVIGQTLTGVGFGALGLDGGSLVVGERLLVKNEVTAANNGIYLVTAVGALAAVYVLTRAGDMNEASEVPGAFCFVEKGTVNAKNGFFVASPGPFTLGTTAIPWSQFTGAGDLTAGTGITLTGNEVAVSSSVANSSALVVSVAAGSGDETGATDLAAIETGITAAAAGGIVRLRAGSLYWVNTPHSMTAHAPSGSSITLPYGVAVPSNVYLDLNGATIRAAAGSVGQVLVNAKPTKEGGDHDLGFGNGTVDGNNNAYNGNAVVGWCWVSKPVVRGRLKVVNGKYVGIYPYGNTGGEYDTLLADTIEGNGIFLGNSPSAGEEAEARIGRAIGRNCTPWPTQALNFPGNSVVVATTGGSFIDTVTGYNCSAGIKVEDLAKDTQVGKAITYGGIGVGNSGFKLQGNGNGTPLRVNVGLVTSINQQGYGLYMEQCVDCSVDRYIGQNNSLIPGFNDVWIGGTNDHIGMLQSSDCGGVPVLVRGYATGYKVDTAFVRNANRNYINAPKTTVAAGSNGQTNLPAKPYNAAATINVASTTGFPTSGTVTVAGDTVAYTGITALTLTGCTGGTHTMATGEAVVLAGLSASNPGISVAGGVGTFGTVECLDGLYPPQTLAVSAVGTGGEFAAGARFWKLTATNAQGETLASNEVNLTFGTTTVAQASDKATLPTGTITVVSTAGWPETGSFTVDAQTVTYTGKTATTFTGCTGGSGEIRWGDSVVSTATTFSAALTWPAAIGATNYKLYRATASNGQTAASSLVATTGNVTSYTDKGEALTAGSLPTYNGASTLGMFRGFDITNELAQVRVGSLKVTGWANAAFKLSGALLRTQNVAAGPPWQGQIVLAAEPTLATGPSYGRLVKSAHYVRPEVSSLSANPQPANGIPWAMPIVLANTITVAEIGANITTIGEVGSLVALCIWADNGFEEPGALLLYAGTIAGDGGTGYKSITGLTKVLEPGRYWLGGVTQKVTTLAPKIEGSTGMVFPTPMPTTGANVTTGTYNGVLGTSQGNTEPVAFAGVAVSGSTAMAVIKAT